MIHEVVLMLLSSAILFGGAVFLVYWLATRDGPQNLWDVYSDNVPPWCWRARAFNRAFSKTDWKCVTCWTQECISVFQRSCRVENDSTSQWCDAAGYWFREGTAKLSNFSVVLENVATNLGNSSSP